MKKKQRRGSFKMLTVEHEPEDIQLTTVQRDRLWFYGHPGVYKYQRAYVPGEFDDPKELAEFAKRDIDLSKVTVIDVFLLPTGDTARAVRRVKDV